MYLLALPARQLSLLLFLDLHYFVGNGVVSLSLGFAYPPLALRQHLRLLGLFPLQVNQVDVVHYLLNVVPTQIKAVALVEFGHQLDHVSWSPHGLLAFRKVALAVPAALLVQRSQERQLVVVVVEDELLVLLGGAQQSQQPLLVGFNARQV